MKFARHANAPPSPARRSPAPPASTAAPAHLLPRLRPGDIAVLDHLDLDRGHRPGAGRRRRRRRGQRRAVRSPGATRTSAPRCWPRPASCSSTASAPRCSPRSSDGAPVRLARGRGVRRGRAGRRRARGSTSTTSPPRWTHARAGLATQLRELHPQHHRVPPPRAGPAAARPGRAPARAPGSRAGRSWSSCRGHDHASRPAPASGASSASSDPVLVGVDARRRRAARRRAAARRRGGRRRRPADGDRVLSAKALRGAREVVVRVDRGDRHGRPPSGSTGSASGRCRFATSGHRRGRRAAPRRRRAAPSLIVGVGMHATLDEFLDRQRAGLASTFLTRLGRARGWSTPRAVPDAVLRPGAALAPARWCCSPAWSPSAAAIAVTPVGQEWADDARPPSTPTCRHVQGLLP